MGNGRLQPPALLWWHMHGGGTAVVAGYPHGSHCHHPRAVGGVSPDLHHLQPYIQMLISSMDTRPFLMATAAVAAMQCV